MSSKPNDLKNSSVFSQYLKVANNGNYVTVCSIQTAMKRYRNQSICSFVDVI